jgi:hypothetical protein
MKKTLMAFSMIVLCYSAFSQENDNWKHEAQKKNANFYRIRSEFKKEFEKKQRMAVCKLQASQIM